MSWSGPTVSDTRFKCRGVYHPLILIIGKTFPFHTGVCPLETSVGMWIGVEAATGNSGHVFVV